MKLRNLKEKDSAGILEWMKASDVNLYFRFNPEEITKDTVRNFINNSMTEENRNFATVDDKDQYLGTISLKNIDFTNRNAEYAVSFRKKAKGTGAANFATNEILYLAFKELELNKVYLNVLSDNIRAIKFYEKMGFEFEGEFKKHIYINGEFKDIRWYGMRKEQYEKTN